MGLLGAMSSAVSGLHANSSAMSAISDNVTNTNTVGYKATDVRFQTLVTKSASATMYSAGGVQSRPYQGVDVQGLLQSTGGNSDYAISGHGMFVVTEQPDASYGDGFAYTRSGSFDVDREGYLVNTAGYYLQGWPLMESDGNPLASNVQVGDETFMKSYIDSKGNIVYVNDSVISEDNLRPFNASEIGGTSIPTSSATMRGYNLPADAKIGDVETASPEIVDSLGAKHYLQTYFYKTNSNQWEIENIPPEGASTLELRSDNGDIYSSLGRLDLTEVPEEGSYLDIGIGSTKIRVNFGDLKANPQTANITEMTGLTSASQGLEFTVDCVNVNSLKNIMDSVAMKLDDILSYGGNGTNSVIKDFVQYQAGSSLSLTTQLDASNYSVQPAGGALTQGVLGMPTVIKLTSGAGNFSLDVPDGTLFEVPAGTLIGANGELSAGAKLSARNDLMVSPSKQPFGTKSYVMGSTVALAADLHPNEYSAVSSIPTGAATTKDYEISFKTDITIGTQTFKAGLPFVVPTGTVISATGDIPTGTALVTGKNLYEDSKGNVLVPPEVEVSLEELQPLYDLGLGWGVPGKEGVPIQPANWVDTRKEAGASSIIIRNQVNKDLLVDVEHLVARGGDVNMGITGGSASATLQGTEVDRKAIPPSPTPSFIINRLADFYTAGSTNTRLNAGSGPKSSEGGILRNSVPAIQFSPSGVPYRILGYDDTTMSKPEAKITINWVNGAEDVNATGDSVPAISMHYGSYGRSDGLTQMGKQYIEGEYSHDGASYGYLTGHTIGKDGVITATFSNDISRPVFQVPLAVFVNPNRMTALNGNLWKASDYSGLPSIREANSAHAGVVEGGALEGSTADLGEEFSKMITVQRAYSGDTKIITTVDSMLQQLIAMKR